MDFKKQLRAIPEILTICLAGKSTITLKSRKTNCHFTYRIIKKEWCYWVQVLVGQDNTTNYMFLGVLRNFGAAGFKFSSHKKSRIDPKTKSFIAFKWFWEELNQHILSKDLEVWREGYCARCGRELTVPDSIKTGFGPVCIRKVMGALL